MAAIPTILAIAYGAMAGCLDLPLGSLPNVETMRADLLTLLQGAVLGWYACICGDAWSSELGELSGEARAACTCRKGSNGFRQGLPAFGLHWWWRACGCCLQAGCGWGCIRVLYWCVYHLAPCGLCLHPLAYIALLWMISGVVHKPDRVCCLACAGDQPRLLTTMQPVRKGTHGGVTLLGLTGAAAGGLLVGAVFYCAAVLSPTLWVFEAQVRMRVWFGAWLCDVLLGALVKVMRAAAWVEQSTWVWHEHFNTACATDWTMLGLPHPCSMLGLLSTS